MNAKGLSAWVLAVTCGAVAPALAIAATGSPGNAAPATGEATVFYAVAKVEIGSAGDIVSVSADSKFSAAVRAAIEKSVRTLAFTPAAVDGVPVGGATYVGMMGCAAPAGNDDYRVAFEYKAHGPRMSRFPHPTYPGDALRAGISGGFDVRISVQPDGTARLDGVEVTQGGARARKAFAKAIETWVGTLRYEPEQVGGRGVTTSLSVPLEFYAGGAVDKALASQRTTTEHSDACQAAFGRERSRRNESVVLNSPFALKPGT